MNSNPMRIYKNNINKSDPIVRINPLEKAIVSKYPGSKSSALILILTAIPRRIEDANKCSCYQDKMASRLKMIIKQSLNWCVIPTNLYLASNSKNM